MQLRLQTDLLVRYGVALVESLLLGRLILKLFAARPDNPAVALIYLLTDPLLRPLAALDAGQPKYGAVLEFSTLALIVLIAIGWMITARIRRRMRPIARKAAGAG